MASTKRKIDVNAFPEKVVVLKEVSLNRKQMKQMYEYFVDRLNDYHFDEDGVVMTTSEMLEFVDEAKFAAVVSKEIKSGMQGVAADDVIEAFLGYDFTEYSIPSYFIDAIQKSKLYKDRIKSSEDQHRERDIARVMAQAKALGLTVTR